MVGQMIMVFAKILLNSYISPLNQPMKLAPWGMDIQEDMEKSVEAIKKYYKETGKFPKMTLEQAKRVMEEIGKDVTATIASINNNLKKNPVQVVIEQETLSKLPEKLLFQFLIGRLKTIARTVDLPLYG